MMLGKGRTAVRKVRTKGSVQRTSTRGTLSPRHLSGEHTLQAATPRPGSMPTQAPQNVSTSRSTTEHISRQRLKNMWVLQINPHWLQSYSINPVFIGNDADLLEICNFHFFFLLERYENKRPMYALLWENANYKTDLEALKSPQNLDCT